MERPVKIKRVDINMSVLADITNVINSALSLLVNVRFKLCNVDDNTDEATVHVETSNTPDDDSLFNTEKRYIRTLIKLLFSTVKQNTDVRMNNEDTKATIMAVSFGLTDTFDNENFKQAFDEFMIRHITDYKKEVQKRIRNGSKYNTIVSLVKKLGASELVNAHTESLSLNFSGKTYKEFREELNNMVSVKTDDIPVDEPTDDPK